MDDDVDDNDGDRYDDDSEKIRTITVKMTTPVRGTMKVRCCRSEDWL